MWLNTTRITDTAIRHYRLALKKSTPRHMVIDGLFNEAMLDNILPLLHQPQQWHTQRHTYSGLYVDSAEWQQADDEERFVQRDLWKCPAQGSASVASEFIEYLRSDEFMALLSRLFGVKITDINVADPDINTNYFRLGVNDFVKQHADDSPGREICMLLYLNKHWEPSASGELVFMGQGGNNIRIAPLYNRCVLFDPSSEGAEHWVERGQGTSADTFRYNVTSWYWGE